MNLQEKVYRRIIESILNGTFGAGTRLVCNDIAEQFKVSQTPVREALLRLEKEGFVYSVPRSGTYVNRFTSEEIREIYNIREVLEGLVARMAAASPNPDLLEKMRNVCEKYKLGIEQKDVNLCVQSDLAFHRILVEASGSKRLMNILESFHIQSISIKKRGVRYWFYAPVYLDEHRGILDVISQGKGQLAEKKIREHIRKGKERVLEQFYPQNRATESLKVLEN